MGIEPTSEAWEAHIKTLKVIDLAAFSYRYRSSGDLVTLTGIVQSKRQDVARSLNFNQLRSSLAVTVRTWKIGHRRWII